MKDLWFNISIILALILFIGVVITSIALPFTETGEENRKLTIKVETYEKILNREFGKTFESYNDYLVYKIEKGE